MNKVLIANRGEIAVRIARTLSALDIPHVVVYHTLDRDTLAVRQATEAIELRGDPPVSAYLDVAQLIAACQASGADAVHPGFGFLAENADFAAALALADITFIGPPPSAIRAMGDKITAKRLAAQAGVPTLPGSPDALTDADEAVAIAGEIGFPVLLKASAGGGGKGMRVAHDADECRSAFTRASSEAAASFGDARVFVERYIARPRHIEVQILADRHGNVVSLGERECSIQRRYQKVIEEAPSPSVTPKRRRELGEAAIALAKAVGYVSAGTVEMVADVDGSSYFLEMNTRLQVEHPVTELVTGIDIVAEQLRLAQGEPLGYDGVELSGHAIEARIYAEDDEFRPAIGTLRRVRWPKDARVDHGLVEGAPVSAAFDPMLAKVCAHSDTRAGAIKRLRSALTETVLLGTTTNTAFLERVLAHPAFAAGETFTTFLTEHDVTDPGPSIEQRNVLFAAAALASPHFDRRHWIPEPLAFMGAWGRVQDRGQAPILHAGMGTGPDPAPVELALAGGAPVPARLVRSARRATLYLDGEPHDVWHERGIARCDGMTVRANVVAHHDSVFIHAFGRDWELTVADPKERARASADQQDTATAPMPGTVVDVQVNPGETVSAGRVLVVIESMKMQSEIAAWRDGTVAKTFLAVGDRFDRGAPLVSLEPV